MDNNSDTYGRTIYLGASRRRLEDAEALYNQERWNGAIYMGGYAIECALKSLICVKEGTDNFKNTKVFKEKRLQGSNLHSLTKLLKALPNTHRQIESLPGHKPYREAWKQVSSWQNDKLRYSDQKGDKIEAREFIDAVKILHKYFVEEQEKG